MRVLIAALVLCLCAWQTHARAQDWRSDRALWSAARRTAPGLARPALNLGLALIHEGQWDAATTELTASTQLYAPFPADPTYFARTADRALLYLSVTRSPCAWSSC